MTTGRLRPEAPSIAVLVAGLALAAAGGCATAPARAPAVDLATGLTYDHGGITRGPRDRPRIALIFTGGHYAEGADAILDALAARDLPASFFVTGDFIRTPGFRRHLRRIVDEGHYLGAHSDAHLLYASWEDRERTLVTGAAFREDLERNLEDLARFGRSRDRMRFFIPPYEWYNREIADWAAGLGLTLFNYTPGTRSNADYMPDSHPRFIASRDIVDDILRYEAQDPDGLNGFLLLLHLGAGPERTDKMHPLIPGLLDELIRRGYSFVRVDELLMPSGSGQARAPARFSWNSRRSPHYVEVAGQASSAAGQLSVNAPGRWSPSSSSAEPPSSGMGAWSPVPPRSAIASHCWRCSQPSRRGS